MTAAHAALARVDRGARSAGDVPPVSTSRAPGDASARPWATTPCPVTGTTGRPGCVGAIGRCGVRFHAHRADAVRLACVGGVVA